MEKIEKINAIKSDHLEKGVKPVIASIIEWGSDKGLDDLSRYVLRKIKQNGEDVDYYQNNKYFEKHKMLSHGMKTWVISDCNEKDKYSMSYRDCTGIVISGIDKETGKEISILSHQEHEYASVLKKEEFENDLSKSIQKIKERSKPRTIDAVMFGGIDMGSEASFDYKPFINNLSKICEKELGFEPVIITSPNPMAGGGTDAFFDTKNRRLYIVKNLQEMKEEGYPILPSNLESKE